MDRQVEPFRYGDPAILEPIVEQQDDEMTTSPESSMNASFLEEERRAREETRLFEEFEREFDSNRRRIRVKVGYSFDDNDQRQQFAQTTHIKTEPCFRVTTTEDPLTKYFYTNEVSSKQLPRTKDEEIERNNQFVEQTSLRTPSKPDSLEEEYSVTLTRGPEVKDNKQAVVAPLLSQSAGRSILKKSRKKEETITKTGRSSVSPPPSPPKKKLTSTRLDFNQVTNLAESSAKRVLSPSCVHPRSLFDATINIFNPTSSSQSPSNNRRPSRLRYYIKPYRGEANMPPDLTKQRSRSLSEKRIAEQSRPTRWYTFSNQYSQSSGKQHHVSWSPVRQYIHHGREKMATTTPNRKETSSSRTSSSMAVRGLLSSSNPCLSTYPSMIPVAVRYRPSRLSQAPQHFRQSLPPSLSNSFDTPSESERSLTPINVMSRYNDRHEDTNEEEKKTVFVSPLPDVVHEHQKEHNQTMKRYEQLLEKMRATDEQLQSLSRSWMANTQKPPVKLGRARTMSLTSTNSGARFFSPLVLQICLLILVICNLLIVYFFNEINSWWNRFVVPAVMVEQHDGETSDY